MKSLFDRWLVCLLGLGALAPLTTGIVVLRSGLPARAETPSSSDRAVSVEPSSNRPLQQIEMTSSYPEVVTQEPLAAPVSNTQLASPNIIGPNTITAAPDSRSARLNSPTNRQLSPTNATEATVASTPAISATTASTAERQPKQLAAAEKPTSIPAPVPGSTSTSATLLATGAAVSPPEVQPTVKSKPQKLSQLDISPGRGTRGGSSYVGIGVNVGLAGGGTDLGNTNFTVLSKIGLTNNFSVRPAAIIGDNATFLIPLTYDFTIRTGDAFSESIPFSPYIGAGIALSTRSGDNVAALLSGGVDVPISDRFTATAGVNVGFFNNTDVGLTIGIGYNFSGLGI